MVNPIKINTLELENVKRIKAVTLQPTANGLTVIGGKNGQGKTSVLDALAWALGGNKFKPSTAQRDGSVLPPALKVTLNNGLIVERKGKNGELKVTDPDGAKAGQQLLDEFIDELALNLPKFMASSNKDKAQTLLKIIGVGDQLYELEQAESRLYNERRTIGQIAEAKEKHASELPYHGDAPDEPVSASELIAEQQEILAQNGENQRKRERVQSISIELNAKREQIGAIGAEMRRLQEQLDDYQSQCDELEADLLVASKTAEELTDASTAELEASLADIEAINIKVRSNLDKERAEDEAREYKAQYDALTEQINDTRQKRMGLLDGADLPLAGLSVEGGELTYKGFAWDNMSGSEQLRVATAIVRKINPQCGFVLLDKLEQMDLDTLTEFGAWLEGEGLQAIATRVSVGEECSVVIEDGHVADIATKPENTPTKSWTEGAF